MLGHHVGQLQGSGRLVGIGQGDLIALTQVERAGQGQHHGLQGEPSTQPFIAVDGVPALPVPRIQVLGENVGRQESPGGRCAEAVVLIQRPGQVRREGLGVPPCQRQTVIAQVVHPVVLEVMTQRLRVVGGHVSTDDALVDVLGQLAVQHGAVGTEPIQPDSAGELGRDDRAQVDAGRTGLQVGLRTAQQVVSGLLETGDEARGLLGVGTRDRTKRSGDAHDGAQSLLAGFVDEAADRVHLGVHIEQTRTDEHRVHAQVEGVLDDGIGAVQLGRPHGR